MSDKEAENVFYRRVRLFAKITFAAAILLVLLAVTTGVLKTLQQPSSQDGVVFIETSDGEAFGRSGKIMAFMYRIASSVVGGALLACGVAIVALVVARMSVRGAPAAFSFPLDERFERKAWRFAQVAHGFAWVYLVAMAISTLLSSLYVFSQAAQWGEAQYKHMVLILSARLSQGAVSAQLKFCMILLCALIVKGLLLLSKRANDERQVSVGGAGDE